MRAFHWFRGDLRLADNTALRVISPVAQGERFDPAGAYVRRFPDYPAPIVDHAERRRIAIVRFEEARRAAALA